MLLVYDERRRFTRYYPKNVEIISLGNKLSSIHDMNVVVWGRKTIEKRKLG